ncbi:MAG: bifunctional homocysteine S-methyltransferase/methylenetetrahydrofolate reductase [bacterium]|nr:bifunctional homocysteine S-methyltransferase/methylenetetrahydrofolate reductase [bacterium]
MKGQEFLQRLETEVVIADGGMGAMLSARGISLTSCLEAVNLMQPELVKALHLEFVAAGSEVIETNSFGANRNKLAASNQADQVKEINAAAVRLAREVVPSHVFVAGSMGPVGRLADPEQELSQEERYSLFREQAEVLLEEKVDLFVLETFSQVEELKVALRAVQDLDGQVPVVCQMAFSDAVRATGGREAVSALLELEGLGASVIGGNCGSGPVGLIHVIEEISQLTEARLSAQPNASFPQFVNGRYIYVSDPEYFAESAERLVGLGANLIGGCCGTTPDHIRLVAQRVKGRAPAARVLRPQPRVRLSRQRKSQKKHEQIYSPVERVGKTAVTLVEVKPPRGMALGAVLRAAKMLKKAGVDAFSLVENSLAQVRMSPIALAHILQEELGVAAVMHCTCRDRNLMGQQSALSGASALGVRTVLALTGDPATMGDSSASTSVYDTNSLGLIELIANLNRGINVAGNRISGASNFVIGGAFNPNVRRLEPEIRRFEKKIARGASFAMTQPVFDPAQIPELYEKTARLNVPIFLGIMPLTTYRNASFLHNEVPGIRIPEQILERMKGVAEDRAVEEGVAIAREMIDAAMDYAPGFYVIPQLEKYEVAAELVQHIKRNEFQVTHKTSLVS